jgi:hypothetical protein
VERLENIFEKKGKVGVPAEQLAMPLASAGSQRAPSLP